MSKWRFGDVALVSFPYIVGAKGKRRPLLILVDIGDDDVIAARITSKPKREDDTFDLELADWKKAKLLRPSVVRVHKLTTIEKDVEIEQKIGRVSKSDLEAIKKKVRRLWKSILV